MLKVKMVSRYTAFSGRKLERGLTYDLPLYFAQELAANGIAMIIEPPKVPEPEELPIEEPTLEEPTAAPEKKTVNKPKPKAAPKAT